MSLLHLRVWSEVGSGAIGPAGTCHSGRCEKQATTSCPRGELVAPAPQSWDGTRDLDHGRPRRSAAMVRFRRSRVLSLAIELDKQDHRAASHAQPGIKPPNDQSAKTMGAYLVQSQLQLQRLLLHSPQGRPPSTSPKSSANNHHVRQEVDECPSD